MMNLMNELVRKDLSDIAQVNVPSWLTLGWVNEWNLSWIKQIDFSSAQGLLSVILLVITIAFTVFKFYRAYVHYTWDKEDRMEELAD